MKVEYLNLEPELLFCVNWADSAPGISWPEAYYVTFIPGLDHYVVTASRDSRDLFGCTDCNWFCERLSASFTGLQNHCYRLLEEPFLRRGAMGGGL